MLASMMSDPQLRVVKLRATEKGKTMEGHALIASGSQLMFYASQLPALPSNRVYQLWLIRSNGPSIASAGVFSPDAANRAVLQLRDPVLLSSVTTIAVTDEPAGGSPLPTGHKWLIGS
jgi:anti-sigma-K factor RskA